MTDRITLFCLRHILPITITVKNGLLRRCGIYAQIWAEHRTFSNLKLRTRSPCRGVQRILTPRVRQWLSLTCSFFKLLWPRRVHSFSSWIPHRVSRRNTKTHSDPHTGQFRIQQSQNTGYGDNAGVITPGPLDTMTIFPNLAFSCFLVGSRSTPSTLHWSAHVFASTCELIDTRHGAQEPTTFATRPGFAVV